MPRTVQQILVIETGDNDVRSSAYGWSADDPSLYTREPVGLNESWDKKLYGSYCYPHVLGALAAGWRLLAPPVKVQGREEYVWWLTRDVERA